MRTREYRYYNNEKQLSLSIHYQNNFDHLLKDNHFDNASQTLFPGESVKH